MVGYFNPDLANLVKHTSVRRNPNGARHTTSDGSSKKPHPYAVRALKLVLTSPTSWSSSCQKNVVMINLSRKPGLEEQHE